MAVAHTDRVERFVERFFVLDARQHAHDTPGDVVVDPGALAGPPDQAEDGELAVGLGVQQVVDVSAGIPEALVRGQDVRAGQVRAELVSDQLRGVRPVRSPICHVAHGRDEFGDTGRPPRLELALRTHRAPGIQATPPGRLPQTHPPGHVRRSAGAPATAAFITALHRAVHQIHPDPATSDDATSPRTK
ncbi:hypothetical protein [Actinoplanes sp. NPDC049118]|uniref:hypothetical protein n=1 Tax=Actinoplanes sp. NPDC049118 TaxID=3155769 RepID=UPI0033CDB9EB